MILIPKCECGHTREDHQNYNDVASTYCCATLGDDKTGCRCWKFKLATVYKQVPRVVIIYGDEHNGWLNVVSDVDLEVWHVDRGFYGEMHRTEVHANVRQVTHELGHDGSEGSVEVVED